MFLKKIDKYTNFKDILLKFSTNDIREMVHNSTIFARGNSYNKRGFVSSVIQTEENRVKAKVLGSSNNSYEVNIYREKGSLHAECNCPYGAVCKHIVATLIHIAQTKTLEVSIVITHQNRVIEYLQTLSNAELIELVMKFAPESFIKEIIIKDIPKEELDIRINKIASAIDRDMDDEDLLYNPEAFQKNIFEYLEKLKPFVNQKSDEVFEIIFDLADEIEDKYENGYLYIDNYYDEKYFDFDTFASKVMELINNIKNREKQIEIFVEFAEICNSSGYMSLDYDDFKIDDKRVFLKYFDEDSSLELYLFIEEFLSFEEKEKFLLNKSTDWVFGLVVELYLEYDKKELAREYIEGLIKKRFNIDYIQKLMEIGEVSQERLREFIIKAIENGSYRNSEFIIEYIEKIEKRDDIEKLLKDRNPDFYYQLLEKENRVDEMFKLLRELKHHKEEFFKKHKKAYPKEAIDFFNAEIEKNLKSTGDEYYHKIADYLTHLKELIDKDEFSLKVQRLKDKYKRRRNFVKILNKRFG